MSSKNCASCNELREVSPDFALNGVTDAIAENLEKDEGLTADDSRNNCDDLHDINDCLVGNMEDELDAYDVCEWKDFMKAFIPNLYDTLKAMIYSECGVLCDLKALFNGLSLKIGEETDGDAYAVAGKGVSFLNAVGSNYGTSDLELTYIAGGLVRGAGSYRFYSDDFTDAAPCGNFDLGSTYRKSTSRKGNDFWGTVVSDGGGKVGKAFPREGELICEFRIKNSAYPFVKRWFNGFGQETGQGVYHIGVRVFGAGSYAFGQHGQCRIEDGVRSENDYDDGHLVPQGWTYIQVRQTGAWRFSASESGAQYTPRFFMGIRMNQDEVEC